MDSVPTAALAPILVLVIGLQLYCLFDLTKSNVRYLPKWGWAAILVFGGVVADVVYLLAGKDNT